jgi:uncharacterized protein YdeI (YjbR/CyaY-like superfamily)
LAQHHDQPGGVWITSYRKAFSADNLVLDDAIEEAICYGWIDGGMRPIDDRCFKLHLSPRRRGGFWSPANRARAERLMTAGLIRPAGLAKIEQAKADGSWTKVDKLSSDVPPPDLAEALDRDPAAAAAVAALAPSSRRVVFAWVRMARRPQTRRKRIASAIAALRSGTLPFAIRRARGFGGSQPN